MYGINQLLLDVTPATVDKYDSRNALCVKQLETLMASTFAVPCVRVFSHTTHKYLVAHCNNPNLY